jgi:hypothetical protein
MKTDITITNITCDACGAKMEKRITSTHEGLPVRIVEVVYERYYCGDYILSDFCETCNEKLLEFMQVNNMFAYARKAGE